MMTINISITETQIWEIKFRYMEKKCKFIYIYIYILLILLESGDSALSYNSYKKKIKSVCCAGHSQHQKERIDKYEKKK
uniref:Uncharacterized protein n=1 Tax=Heterorhabditis bacteriophora TaxID=37862 RepID=A0A1I7WAS1_HETBA